MLSLFHHRIFRRVRRWFRRKKFLCPNCLCWNKYKLACGGCWLKIDDNAGDTCPRCRSSLNSDAVRACCLTCGAATLHYAYHQREARVLAVLRQEDFTSFLNSVDAAGDASAREMLGYAIDNGTSLICLLNLSAFTKNVIERTDVFWEVEGVWVDGANDGPPEILANSLKKAADQVIQRGGLAAGQRQLPFCVRQQGLPATTARDLEIRFGSLKFGVEATEFLRDEMSTMQEAIGRVGQLWDIATLMSDLTIGMKAAREAAREQLVSIGAPAVPALIDTLGSAYWFVRKNAAETLGMIVDPSVVPVFVENAMCQYLLERQLIESAVPALIQTLQDGDRDVRVSAAEALGKIGLPALPAVIDTLKHRESAIPACAAIALKRIGSRAMSDLITTFNRSENSVRANIAEVMGLIGDPAAVPALVDTFRYKDSLMQETVMQALKRIGGQALPTIKEADKKYHQGSGCRLCRLASELKSATT